MLRLIDGDPRRLQTLSPSKVVHIKVIEQQGTKAVIELNGVRMQATMEQGLPGSFLAFVEETDGIFHLKPLSRVKHSPGFQELNRLQLLEKIEAFFMEHNLPFSPGLLRIALHFTENGLKLDKTLLNFFYRISIQAGEGEALFLIYILSRGADLDREDVQFLLHLKQVLRMLLSDEEKTPSVESGGRKSTDLIKEFLAGIFQIRYDARLMKRDGQEYLVQVMDSSQDDQKRYFFDISQDFTLLLTIDWSDEACDISVYVEQSLYAGIKDGLYKNRNQLVHSVTALVPGRQVTLQFFSTDRSMNLFELENTLPRSGNASNLDVFV